MKKLAFYDLKKRRRFETDNYEIIEREDPKTGRIKTYAITKAPSGIDALHLIKINRYSQKPSST